MSCAVCCTSFDCGCSDDVVTYSWRFFSLFLIIFLLCTRVCVRVRVHVPILTPVDEKLSNPRASLTAWWARKRIADLEPTSPITITPDVTCREAIEIMSSQAFDMVPVQSENDGKVLGVLTEGNLTSMITQVRRREVHRKGG